MEFLQGLSKWSVCRLSAWTRQRWQKQGLKIRNQSLQFAHSAHIRISFSASTHGSWISICLHRQVRARILPGAIYLPQCPLLPHRVLRAHIRISFAASTHGSHSACADMLMRVVCCTCTNRYLLFGQHTWISFCLHRHGSALKLPLFSFLSALFEGYLLIAEAQQVTVVAARTRPLTLREAMSQKSSHRPRAYQITNPKRARCWGKTLCYTLCVSGCVYETVPFVPLRGW